MTTNELMELEEFCLKLIGWTKCSHKLCSGWHSPDGSASGDWPHPTTDPAAAMEVLKKCAEQSEILAGNVMVAKYRDLENFEGWRVALDVYGMATYKIDVVSETLELAICLFAKKLFEPTKP